MSLIHYSPGDVVSIVLSHNIAFDIIIVMTPTLPVRKCRVRNWTSYQEKKQNKLSAIVPPASTAWVVDMWLWEYCSG